MTAVTVRTEITLLPFLSFPFPFAYMYIYMYVYVCSSKIFVVILRFFAKLQRIDAKRGG